MIDDVDPNPNPDRSPRPSKLARTPRPPCLKVMGLSRMVSSNASDDQVGEVRFQRRLRGNPFLLPSLDDFSLTLDPLPSESDRGDGGGGGDPSRNICVAMPVYPDGDLLKYLQINGV